MFNQSCGNQQGCSCQMNSMMSDCGMDNAQMASGFNGCPRPQPLVAPRRVCVSNQVTRVPQPVICPIECRRVNHCMYFPVFIPQYEHTFVNAANNQLY